MWNTRVVATGKEIEKSAADMLVFCAIQADNGSPICDARIKPLVKPLVKMNDFTGKEGEVALFYAHEKNRSYTFSAKRILIIGLGKPGDKTDSAQTRDAYRCAGGTIGKYCEKFKIKDLLVRAEGGLGLEAPEVAECIGEGVLLSDYRFIKYKKDDPENEPYNGLEKLTFHAVSHTAAVRNRVRLASAAAHATCKARDMANEPGNSWTPRHFAEYANTLARQYSLKCKVLEKSDMKRLHMGGMLAVNQGSAEPPKMVILEYRPSTKCDTVLLVGKGLTFDSGGISLKPAAGMQDMKYDMCGGAAVLAAMQVIAEEKPGVGVVAIVPSTDNMSGSSALKPGDIIRHYNGLTSEIVNTDAEGRLILADALAYGIKKYSPDCVIDIATLTGAVIIALGHHRTGIFSNNDRLVELLTCAGGRGGEPMWRLPLGKEYSKQIESQVADIKNTGGRPAGSITAAIYLEKFIGETPWAHLDIAGTAWDFTEKTYIPKGPSGIGVRTLVEFVRGWKNTKLV